jgi:ribose transport system permease protein
VSLVCGLLNGLMVIGLGVHPFIITLGTMWILRGIAFVISHAESILVPTALTGVVKATLGARSALYPVPLLVMLAVTVVGAVYLTRTVMGRHVFAIGGNAEASRFSGLNTSRIQLGVYVLSGLTAGIAAFVGAAFYGSATSSDGTGYELYVIASAVVGGASLIGGKGSALSAMLGALLIAMIRQAIRTLHLDQNYEWIIIGGALIIADVLDQSGSRLLARRLAAGAANRPARAA